MQLSETMNDPLHNLISQQAKRTSEEQSHQQDQGQNHMFQLNQGLNPGPAAMLLHHQSPSASVGLGLQQMAAAMLPSGVSNDSQVSPLGISSEIKRLQQLHQLGSAPTNPLLMASQRQPADPSSAILQSYLDHKVQSSRLEDPIQKQPMLQSQFLQDARLLMNQPPLGNVPHLQSRSEVPLPSPHSLFHRDGSRRMRGGVIEPFPEKLHRLLHEVEASGRSDVISFVASGRAFSIHKPDKFFKEIVPLYFRQSRLSSFKRQLNLYGFELINTGPARGGYYHELFVKDRPELCRRMRRVAVKVVAKQDADTEQTQKEDNKNKGQNQNQTVHQPRKVRLKGEEDTN